MYEGKITDADVLAYIASSAESMIEDDLNESGRWTNEQFEELYERAMAWISEHRAD